MKRFLITTLLSFIILSSSQVEAKNLQFAQISDMRLSLIAQDEIEEGTLTPGDYLLQAIKEINENKEIKFVIFSGDSIDKPDKKAFSKFLTIADKLNKPYYIVIGEKEVLRREDFDKKKLMRSYKRHNLSMIFKRPNYVMKPNKEFAFIFVDGTNEVIPTTSGYFNPKTLAWLDKQLEKYKNKKVVIVQHYPIIPPSGKIMHKTVEPEKYFQVINAHENVIAILSGHFHVDSTIYKKGVYHISAPAFKGESHEYKVINIEYDPKYLFSDPAEFEITQKVIPLVKIEEEIPVSDITDEINETTEIDAESDIINIPEEN